MDLAIARRAASRIGVPVATLLARRARGEKPCSACRLWLPLSEYNRNRSAGDGLHSWCRTCSREKQRRQSSYRTRSDRGRVRTCDTKAGRGSGQAPVPPGHEERILRYIERAHHNLPLFTEEEA